MIRSDVHTHTTYSDGKNTPEEMILSAIRKGFSVIGISDHGYAPCDLDCCMPREKAHYYRQEIRALKEKYKDKITVLCGIEQDLFGAESTDGFDYVIGSVHYVRAGQAFIPIDLTRTTLFVAAKAYFGGDIYALAERYYEHMAMIPAVTHADIIGHFDLITKFDEPRPVFDTSHPRYIAAWQKAVDALIPYGIPFEINTGAMARGYRTSPYPAADIREYIRSKGGKFILTSDSHSAENIGFGFAELEKEI